MERRLPLTGLAVITAALWWFYARHLAVPWAEIAVGATLVGGACGVYASRRRWWLPLLPLPVFAVGGIALSFAFSNTHALSGGGNWSARAVVAFGGIWFGLIAAGVLLAVIAVRGAARLVAG